MNTVEGELVNAIEELCFELLSAKSAADADLVLRAAAALVASSRTAQTIFGRALVAKQTPLAGTRLQVLTERYLYDAISSRATLTLLAVLAHEHLANQRRIARHVPGMCISWSRPLGPTSTTSTTHYLNRPLELLVLSLPKSLRTQYKQWRRRHRLLHGHRVPTGDPPSQNGVPAACFCNDCLGTPQHMATWADHQQDISRWSHIDDSVKPQSPLPLPQFSSDAFLHRVFDNDYSLARCPSTVISGKPRDTARSQLDGDLAAIYYFTSTLSADQSNNDRAEARSPNPSRDACAIAIDPSIACIVSARRDRITNTQRRNEGQLDRITLDDEAVIDRVVLLHQQATLQYCNNTRAEKQNAKIPMTWTWSSRIAGFVQGIQPRDGESSALSASQLHDQAQTSHSLEPVDRIILCAILQFLEPHVPITHATLENALILKTTQPSQTDEDTTPFDSSAKVEIYDIRVSVSLSDQMLEIVAQSHDGFAHSRSIRVPVLPSKTLTGDLPDVCALDDDSLCRLLDVCRICRHPEHRSDDFGNISGWICLVPLSTADISLASPFKRPEEDKINREEPVALTAGSARSMIQTHGLSPSAERSLQALRQTLASPSHARIADVTHHLQRIVHECNTRMTALASECRLTSSVREAARERCRVCRDLLVQAGKRMKLGIRNEATDILSDAAASRLKREIHRVLQLNKASDAWEMPDPRIEQLHLSRQVWASGVPDPEFFVDRDARTKANRVAQRHLNQQLIDRARRR